MLKIKLNKFIFINVIIGLALSSWPVLARSYRPPRMEKKQPTQGATVSGSRGSCPDYSESIIPLFPKADNLKTTLARPVFLFHLKSPLENPAYFSLVGEDKIYPLYQRKIDKSEAKLLAFKLPPHLELTSNQTYRLNFIIVCNEKKPSHNWSVTALVTRIPPSSVSLSATKATSPSVEQATLLSQAGLWFDALQRIYQENLVNDSNFSNLLNNYQPE